MSTMTHQERLAGTRRHRTGLIPALMQVFATRRQRRSLVDLDDAMLRDIGLTRHQALVESQRPLWDVPATWRK